MINNDFLIFPPSAAQHIADSQSQHLLISQHGEQEASKQQPLQAHAMTKLHLQFNRPAFRIAS
jgi:hypothetical protein